MAFTPQQKRDYREKEKNLMTILDLLVSRDMLAGGVHYKSEVLNYETLGKIFIGVPWRANQAEEDKRGKKKKSKPVSPFDTCIMGITKTKYDSVEDLMVSF